MENNTYGEVPADDAGLESADLASVEKGHELETEVVETETKEEANSQPESAEDSEGKEENAETESKNDEPAWIKKTIFDKRIGKTTAKLRTAEDENRTLKDEMTQLREEMNRLKNPVQEPQVLTKEDFATEEEYLDYKVDQKLQAKIDSYSKNQTEENQKNQIREQRRKNFSSKVDAVRDTLPSDYDETLKSAVGVRLDDSLISEIDTSEYAPELAYYFAKNPEDAQGYETMTVRQQGIFLNTLEKEIEKGRASKSVKPPTQAPPPTPKPKGTGSGSVDISKLEGSAYRKARAKQKADLRKK